MKIIDGKKIAEEILAEVKKGVAALPFVPEFTDVLVGSDPASVQYVNRKKKIAESVGIKFHGANFPADIKTSELALELAKLNNVENICGIIVQLPLPEHIDRQEVLDVIDQRLDVDCLGTAASEKFYRGENEIGYPAALACLALLGSLNLDLQNKKIAVLGEGVLVGRPVAALLRFQGVEPEVVSAATKNKEDIIRNAELIISGIGKGKYLTRAMIRPGAVIIDAGTSEMDSGIVGDVDLDSVRDVAGYVSPVPGGVGPVTVAMLLRNVLMVAKAKTSPNLSL